MVYRETLRIVSDLISKDPTSWLKVKDVAEMYSRAYYDLLSTRAEKEVLWPLGLTKDTFIKRQNEMNPDLVVELSSNLSKFSLRDTGAIIVGNDGDANEPTPHIFVITNGNIECNDDIGFASIGIGHWHANSQFMFSGHTKFTPGHKQLLNTFWAKKRAEVAPGVGSETDMFIIGNRLGTFSLVLPRIIDDLNRMYQVYDKNVKKIEKNALERVGSYLKQASKQQQAEQQPPKDNPS